MEDIHRACINSDYEIVKRLLDANPALVNEKDDDDGWTPLRYAVACDDLKLVEILVVTYKCDVNARLHDGVTVLHYSVVDIERILAIYRRFGDGEVDIERLFAVTKLLLDNGANINIRNNKGESPLMLAHDARVINLLNKYDIEIKEPDV